MTASQLRAKVRVASLAVLGGISLSADGCSSKGGDGKGGNTPSTFDFTTADYTTNGNLKSAIDAKADKTAVVTYDATARELKYTDAQGKVTTVPVSGSGLDKTGIEALKDLNLDASTKVAGKTIADHFASHSIVDLLADQTTKYAVDPEGAITKDTAATPATTSKTFVQILKDLVGSSANPNAVDKNDAKIVVKGAVNASDHNKFDHKATFEKKEENSSTNSTRDIEISKEFEKGAERVKALEDAKQAADKEILALKNNTAEALRLLAKNATYANAATSSDVKNEMKESVSEGLFLGLISTNQLVGNAATIDAAIAKGWFGKTALNGLYKGCIFAHWKNDGGIDGVTFYKINVSHDSGGNNTAHVLNASGKWDTTGTTVIGS